MMSGTVHAATQLTRGSEQGSHSPRIHAHDEESF